jgi:16S rRNA (uracil1498-N3)-methyltransferase
VPIGPDPAHPFAYVDDLASPALGDADRHHLERVRRLRTGAPLTVGDGAGSFRAATFGPTLTAAGPVESVPAPAPPVTVGFALTKGDKPELVVQKLTEIGADVIVPFVAERSIARWDEHKAARNVERWRAIAREAGQQAHRPHLPVVAAITTFAGAAAGGAVLAHWEGDLQPLEPGTPVLVGPEGGWSPAELAAAAGRVGLGPHVLRAETAALVAGALLVAARAR